MYYVYIHKHGVDINRFFFIHIARGYTKGVLSLFFYLYIQKK